MSKKIDIISAYLGDYQAKFSGREIARIIGSNPQTALNRLNELVKENILKKGTKGRNKEYSLNFSNIKSRMLIEIAENSKSFEILKNKELFFIISDLLLHAESIVMFGSFVKGLSSKDSDVDLIIAGKSDKEKIKNIRKRYNRKISIEYVTLKELEGSLKQKKALAIEILKNHAVFGNISKIINIFYEWYLR